MDYFFNRVKNLMKTSSKMQILPTYYQIYGQDTPALSSAIESTLMSNDPNSTYQPYFLYFKFGQQQPVTSVPITLRSTNLDLVITDPSRIFRAPVHLAINFEHRDPRYSVFWSTQTINCWVPPGTVYQKIPFAGSF